VPEVKAAFDQEFTRFIKSFNKIQFADQSANYIRAIYNDSEAEKLYIYTDVDGVYTIDPNIVPTAQKIDKISFQEMAEMANFGAKILHPSTLEPCLRSSIPVKILSTFKPDGKGTDIVFDKQDESETLIKAVTIRRKQILVTLKSINMVNAYGFLANIFNILAKYKISVDLITTSEINIALTIDGNMLGSQEINPFIENKELLLQEAHEAIRPVNISIFSQTLEERRALGRRSGLKCKERGTGVCGIPPEEQSIRMTKTNLQKWECLETGFVTNAGCLSRYQNKRDIDTSNRRRIA
jgi:aspartate kinase